MKLITAITVLFMLLPPNPFDSKWAGAYYYDLNFYWCTSHSSCVHEIGHYLDDMGGMVSQSEDFIEATKELVEVFPGEESNPYTNKTMELYAHIYEIADGNPLRLPSSLSQFYDWDLGKIYIDKLTYVDDH